MAPAVHNFSDLRPSSRALTIVPRPASRKSAVCGTLDRPHSQRSSRAESNAFFSPRGSKGISSNVLILSPGRQGSELSWGEE